MNENEEGGGYLLNSDAKEEDEERIEMQALFSSACCGLFALFIIIGGVLFAIGKDKPTSQTIIYRQAPQLRQMSQYQPPMQQYIPPQQQPQAPNIREEFTKDTWDDDNCPFCGETIKTKWKLCPNCGGKLEQRY